jgi:predicted metal-dependent phosphoesterase TrpH
MAPRYDLHSHTLRSDGTLTPSELVAQARAAGVDVLALTDHDVTDGLTEAQAAASQHGLQLVPGVEVSVTWERLTVHVVGLNIDPANAELQHGLARLREFRHARALEIGRRLAKHRVPGAYEGAMQLAKGAIVSRTHFARFLVSKGHVGTMADAFRHYLTRNCPGHVPGQWATLDEAIRWIRAAGGVATLAHPSRYKLSSGRLRALLSQFKECGGTAIEVVCGSNTPDINAHFTRLAREHGFYASLGSDYHGPEASGVSWGGLGRLPPLPEGLMPVWQAWEPPTMGLTQQA